MDIFKTRKNMNFAGKVMVKVAEMENGFILWRDFLIVPEELKEELKEEKTEIVSEVEAEIIAQVEAAEETETAKVTEVAKVEKAVEKTEIPNALRIYRIEKELTDREIRAITWDIDKGIKKVAHKLNERGPIIVRADRIYIDDILIIQTKNEGAAIIAEMEL